MKNQNFELQDIIENQKAQLEEQDQKLHHLQVEHDNYVEELKNELQTQLTEQFVRNKLLWRLLMCCLYRKKI